MAHPVRGDRGSSRQRVRASLLDRLIDEEPGGPRERPPFRTQSVGQYARSVVRDLQWLFNTRCTKRFDVGREAGPRTVLDYGVDDFTHLAAASHVDRALLAKNIKEAIVAFEPRLKVKLVSVEADEGDRQRAVIYIEAGLIIEDTLEPVSFRVVVNNATGEVMVDGS